MPASPVGASVKIAADGAVSGVYPDWLRAIGAAAGCQFVFPQVPRARADHMVLDATDGDLLIPASQTSERDGKALFIPLIRVTPAFITLKSRQAGVPSLDRLRSDPSLRAVLVRRFNYGDDYQALVAAMEKDGRVQYVTDIDAVVRMLASGRGDFTVMAPTLFHSTLAELPAPAVSAELFHYEPFEALPTTESGLYLSPRSLRDSDLKELRQTLESPAAANELWRLFNRYYPSSTLRAVRLRR